MVMTSHKGAWRGQAGCGATIGYDTGDVMVIEDENRGSRDCPMLHVAYRTTLTIF